MATVSIDRFRNITFLGHGGCGKTSLVEAMLFKAGATKRLGSVADKTSILDFTEEEKDKLASLDSAVCHLSYKDLTVNIVDTPGTPSLCGTAIASLIAADCAMVVVGASSGVQVNTRRMFDRAKSYGLGTWIIINHIDSTNIDLADVVGKIQETFGAQCVPLNLPSDGGKSVIDCFANESGASDILDVGEVHTNLIETIVGADEAMMEKYLGGELSDEEAKAAAANAVAQGELVPILFTNSIADVGITEMLDALEAFCPSPVACKPRTMVHDDVETTIEASQDGPFVGQVFKVSIDPKSNIKYLGLRILSGKLTSDTNLKSVDHPKGMRPGHVIRMQGVEHTEIEAGVAGDIVCLAKVDVHIGNTLYAKEDGKVAPPVFTVPMYSLAIESKSHGDEDKINAAFKRYAEEDPCFVTERGTGGEMVIRGMGEMQLRTYLSHMAKHHKLEVITKPPRIPYRETIQGEARNIEYTHKKQSGGSGQFGRVIINVLPAERGEGYEFVDKIFGGVIDQSYRPSVDKGVRAQMAAGVLAGYPVVDVKVELIDGKTHPVDSKDVAFQIAGRGAFKEGFLKAKPALLEPIVNLEVTVPADKVGDIQGDIASRRGRPVGQDVLPGNLAAIHAVVPLAELADYNSKLSSVTGGEGSYSIEFSHYEPVPGNVQQQIIDAHKKEVEESGHH